MNLSLEATALGLTILAGLSTGVGSIIALVAKRKTSRFLSTALGFSAGVMIYVSLVEIFQEARVDLCGHWGARPGYWGAVAGFFGGIALIAAIDKLVPPVVNPHESRAGEAAAYEAADLRACPADAPHAARRGRLMRTGLLTAFVVALHNFPEGIATFLSVMRNPEVGVAVALAIAVHNIPEGISISVPVYFATGSRRRAFWYSFASGLAEPAGAVIGYLFLRPYLGGPLFGLVLAGVAGIMVYISLDELLPAAREFGEPHFAMGGLVAGMAVMASSLVMLA
ncbi:MAG: zinc transporter ZupT [Spirochaetaceae bacterium]|nr:zinc transporter ZupT [Spirochaetaceae bacterium]